MEKSAQSPCGQIASVGVPVGCVRIATASPTTRPCCGNTAGNRTVSQMTDTHDLAGPPICGPAFFVREQS